MFILCVYSLLRFSPNAAKLTGCCFIQQMDNDPKHKAKITQDKEIRYSSLGKTITCRSATTVEQLFTY